MKKLKIISLLTIGLLTASLSYAISNPEVTITNDSDHDIKIVTDNAKHGNWHGDMGNNGNKDLGPKQSLNIHLTHTNGESEGNFTVGNLQIDKCQVTLKLIAGRHAICPNGDSSCQVQGYSLTKDSQYDPGNKNCQSKNWSGEFTWKSVTSNHHFHIHYHN